MNQNKEPTAEIHQEDDGTQLLVVTCASGPWQHRFKTKSAAQMAARKRIAVQRDPSLGHTTAREFATEWLCDYVTRECMLLTARDYRCCLNRVVLPRVGETPIDEITREGVRAIINQFKEAGDFVTLERFRATLSAMLSVAASWGYIPFNPVKRYRRH